jgi:hypothetical protein
VATLPVPPAEPEVPSLPSIQLRPRRGVTGLVHALLTGDEPARTHAAVRLATEAAEGLPAYALSTLHSGLLPSSLPGLLQRSHGRERAALLALCAALGPSLPVEVRTTLRELAHPAEGSDDTALAVAASVSSLLVEDFAISDDLLRDLTALVQLTASAPPLPRSGTARQRAIALTLAIATGREA